MKAEKTDSISLNGSILSGGGKFRYLAPEISIQKITVESGFADSLSISSPDDDDLPQIGGLDNWDGWE